MAKLTLADHTNQAKEDRARVNHLVTFIRNESDLYPTCCAIVASAGVAQVRAWPSMANRGAMRLCLRHSEPPFTVRQILLAAVELEDYYRQHVAEM